MDEAGDPTGEEDLILDPDLPFIDFFDVIKFDGSPIFQMDTGKQMGDVVPFFGVGDLKDVWYLDQNLLEALMYGVKSKGTAISSKEIDSIKALA